ncbi:MAG: chloride channel protein [Desulfuromonadaceae bacterium]|nr:chloride channel protein [Desulfuromonadaceae bacterium]MDD5107192.1 chloride channel protein [Desulfuromonadaceae bacterium]
MKQHLTEQFTLFASVVKWALYASLVGVLVGVGTTVFLRSLSWATIKFGSLPGTYLYLPLVILISAALVRWLAPDAAGHGTERVIEAVHKKMGKIPLAVIPVKLVATVITLAGWGSAGKEGPAAQIGAGLASACADLLRVDDLDRRKLVICGISAGFATVFGTPVAGALFGVEVLVLGQMFYEVLFPSFVAGIVSYHVAVQLGGVYPHEIAPLIPHFNGWSLLEILLLGVWCGLAALFLIEIMKYGHKVFEEFTFHWSVKALLGGVLLIAIGRFVSPSYLGLGLDTLQNGFRGDPIPFGAFFWKSIATSITLGSGGSGGVVTPIFFVGTSAGNLFAQLFSPHYLAAYSAIGMVAVLAGTANTPIAASVMAIELFGTAIAPYAALACMVSYLIAGYRSIYPSQVLGGQKSASLTVATGMPIGELGSVVLKPHQSSLVGMALKVRIRKKNPNVDSGNRPAEFVNNSDDKDGVI